MLDNASRRPAVTSSKTTEIVPPTNAHRRYANHELNASRGRKAGRLYGFNPASTVVLAAEEPTTFFLVTPDSYV
jgi:hypothetical protein